MNADALNAVLRRGRKRGLELEPKLAAALIPVLVRAGDDAAREFQSRAVDHLAAGGNDTALLAALGVESARNLARSLALTAAAPGLSPASTMIALYPRPDEAAALAAPDGEDPAILHVTLAYLGETESEQLRPLVDALRVTASRHAPLAGEVAGIGLFPANPGAAPGILLPDVRGLVEVRVDVTQKILEAGLDYSRDHGFQPHITSNYGNGIPSEDKVGLPLHFDALVVARGDVVVAELPFAGPAPITAAASQDEVAAARRVMDEEADRLRAALRGGTEAEIRAAKQALDAARLRLRDAATQAGRAAGWTVPAADEVVNVDHLVASFRGKTDPVREATIQSVVGETLREAGIDFTASNPFIARLMEKAGEHITHIAETTREDVRAIVAESYQAGLSIPSTASAIRAGMLSAAGPRATLIARTELVRATNGAAVAAARTVADATGVGYSKVWMTAPGAKWPRHEEYDGLDGQTVPIGDYFDVGGSACEHPGDGPISEAANCRCAVRFIEAGEG